MAIEKIQNGKVFRRKFEINKEIEKLQIEILNNPYKKKYNEKKIDILRTGIGRIYLINDKEISDDKYEGRNRRIVITANGKQYYLVNSIYTRNSYKKIKNKKYPRRTKITSKDVPILNYDSYIEIECVKIKKNQLNKYDSETTSTINPNDFKKINDFIFHNKDLFKISKTNRIKRKNIK